MTAAAAARVRRWIRRGVIAAACGTAFLGGLGAYGWWIEPGLLVHPLRRAVQLRLGIAVRTVEAEGVEWPCLESGPPTGRPMVLLHGFGTSKDAMLTLLAHFGAAGWHCLAPDLPGFGDHPCHGDEPHDGAFYARAVGAFMQAAGMPRATVLGTSMGGAVAAELAIREPDRVDALVLLSPAGVEPPVRNAFMRRVDAGENPLDIADEAGLESVSRLVFLHPPAIPAPFRRWYVEEALRRRPCTLSIIPVIKPFLEDGLRGRMAAIGAPTFVLYGSQDAVTDPSMRAVFEAEIPSCRTVVVPDAGHVAFADNWPAVQRELDGFLQPGRAPAVQR